MNENSFMTVPENLDKLSKDMEVSVRQHLTVTDTMLENKKIYDAISEGGAEQILAVQPLRKGLAQNSSASLYVGTASDQSGGKSTLTNSILEYPLLPTAMTTTTACATEIRYGASPSLQIQYYARPEGNVFEEDGPVFDGKHVLGNEIWQRLLEFAILCVREKVIYAETLQYHASRNLDEVDVTWRDLKMSARDPRHVVQMLLILFTTYVGQNDPKPNNSTAEVCAERENLIRILKVNPNRDYAVRVCWDHPALKQGLVIVDLPGLSANAPEATAPDGTARRSHERISVDYLQNVDAIFLLFDPTGLAGGASKILATVLAGERMKHIISKENRIIPILNKVDLPGAEPQIPYSINQIRQILGDLKVPYVYPMSTLSGEYRFVENGVTSIKHTQAYMRSHESVRESFRDFQGIEPTQEQVENKVQSNLKKSYEKAYQFADVNGAPCSISLGQWIQMMTTDYLSRAQALNVIELLRIGMEANRAVIQSVQTRKLMLEMLKKGGKELTGSLIHSLADTVDGCMGDFNKQFQAAQKKPINKLKALSIEKIPEISYSYIKALNTVEDAIAALIGGAVDKMKPNMFGNIILNPEDAIREDSKKLAEENKSIFEGLLTKLGEFRVRDRLTGSENLLSTIVSEVQKTYEDAILLLAERYDGLIGNISVSMDNAYEQSKTASGNPDYFETIYGALYLQLQHSLIKELDQSVNMVKDVLLEDERMVDMQKATIDAAASISVDLQDKYRSSSDRYIRKMRKKTAAKSDAFDIDKLKATLQIPFFSAATKAQYAQKVTDIFNLEYANNILVVMHDIGSDMFKHNTIDIKDHVKGLTAFIKQKLGQGEQELDNEIANLKFYSDYIRRQMTELMKNISGPWEVLHGCAWAVNELDAIRTIYEDLCAAAERTASVPDTMRG